MTSRSLEAVVAEFLRNVLASDALGVPKLEARARAAGLLGEGQRITHAKVFKRTKKFLGIKKFDKNHEKPVDINAKSEIGSPGRSARTE